MVVLSVTALARLLAAAMLYGATGCSPFASPYNLATTSRLLLAPLDFSLVNLLFLAATIVLAQATLLFYIVQRLHSTSKYAPNIRHHIKVLPAGVLCLVILAML